MLGGPAEALTKLLQGEGVEGKGSITSSSGGIKIMRNGIRCFSVEVSCEDGVQYGITAYDEEAVELYTVAKDKYMFQEIREGHAIPLVTV